jgi:hypothetical protein
MASFLGGLGQALLGGLGGMGGGGGMLGSLFGGGAGGGSGSSMSGNTGGSSSGGGLGDAFGGILRTLAPIAGTALGTYFGGPAGGMIGGNLAGALSNSLFGGDSSQQQSQQQQGYGPQQSYGNQFGTSMGNTLNQGFNQYIPQQLQGQNFSDIGGSLGGYLGGQFGHPNAGRMIGNLINPFLQNAMPQSMRGQQIGNFGGYLGQQAGQQVDQMMQNRGFNPSMGGGYSGRNQFDSGMTEGYGNIPEAPPLGDIYNSRPSGGYGSRSNSNSYPMQEPSAGRSALLNDIRNFRRSPSEQPQSGYGNIPEAPPFDLYNSSPARNSSGFGIRSGVSRPSSLFSEFTDRASQPNMGLRPTQTRASGAYPSSGNDSMMDMLRNRLGNIRRDVSPNEFPRNYTVMGA